MNKQKEKEKKYFEKFQSQYLVPKGNVIFTESPDVIIDGEKTIGIELTDFYPEDGDVIESRQKQKDLREKTLSKAQEKFLGKADLYFDFDETKTITSTRVEPLAKDIAGLGNVITEKFMHKGIIHPNIYSYIPEVRLIYKGLDKLAKGELKIGQVHTSQSLRKERVCQIVKRKEEKAKKYKLCDEYWLLIIMDFFDRAQDQLEPDDFQSVHSDVFDRVIFWRMDFSKPYDLK